MIDWQKILWDLKRDYKHLAIIAKEVDYNVSTLRNLARGDRKHDLPYTVGNKLINLHKKYCNYIK